MVPGESIPLDGHQRPEPSFSDVEGRDFDIPEDAGRRVALLENLFRDFPEGGEVLLWITEWGVWPSGERLHMFKRFLASYGEDRQLDDVPAFVFGANEREDLISFAAFAILFLWDCHVLTSDGEAWLFLSHDEMGWICSRRKRTIAIS